MGLDLRLTSKLSQRLVMTPQLQQAIKILQLPRGELDSLIDEELAENPVVERVTDEETVFDDAHGNGAEPGRTGHATDAAADQRSPLSDSLADSARNDEIDWQTYLSTYNNNNDMPALPPTRAAAVDDERQNAPEDRFPDTESLADHLAWQLRFCNLTEAEERLASLIIGNLNVDGYLEADIEELAELAGVSPAHVEDVLRVIQSCDPPGVAARDLKECLLLQLRAPRQPESGEADGDESLRTLTTSIVRDHLHALETRRYVQLARQIGVGQADIRRALKLIASLEPKPGRQYGDGDIRYVTPDVYLHLVDGEYIVALNEDGLPRLKVNNAYRRFLTQSGETKDYVREKLRAAAWLIRSIHQRQRTLLSVAESLVKFQEDFLNHGISHMRPLVLRDVADDIGTHESTVSRAIANKYIATPRGLYPLKKFFTTGLKRRDGRDVSAESVKAQIRKLIDQEDPEKPLSDEAIAERLAHSNVKIARRTVAKYREGLSILPSAKRKQINAHATTAR